MNKETTVDRYRFSAIVGVIGTIIIAIGILLNVTNFNAKKIYELPELLMLIGFFVIVFAVYNVYLKAKNDIDVVFSKKIIQNWFLNNAIILSLVVLMIIIAFIEPRFIQGRVLKDILSQSSTRLILALGISFTLLIGGTDLSAGRMVGLAAVISASLMQKADYANRFFPDMPQVSILMPIVLAIIACMVFGLINGILSANFNLPPFIATLAVQVMIYGACSLYFDMPPNKSQPIGGIRSDFAQIGQGSLFKGGIILKDGIPNLIIIALFFVVLIWFILNMTVFGKNVYAIGGNRQAAIVSGINVKSVILIVFMLASSLYAVSGVLEAARTAGATNNYGTGYELDAIAACVVGGVSLNGGVGKVSGIVIGVLAFTVIQYGLTFINLSPYWQQIIKGIIIALAVAIDISKYNKN